MTLIFIYLFVMDQLVHRFLCTNLAPHRGPVMGTVRFTVCVCVCLCVICLEIPPDFSCHTYFPSLTHDHFLLFISVSQTTVEHHMKYCITVPVVVVVVVQSVLRIGTLWIISRPCI